MQRRGQRLFEFILLSPYIIVYFQNQKFVIKNNINK